MTFIASHSTHLGLIIIVTIVKVYMLPGMFHLATVVE